MVLSMFHVSATQTTPDAWCFGCCKIGYQTSCSKRSWPIVSLINGSQNTRHLGARNLNSRTHKHMQVTQPSEKPVM
jgi:hypothetical protein